jgi:hypothetical protein
MGQNVRGTGSLVFGIGGGGIKGGVGKNGWGSVGLFEVLRDGRGRGSGISSGATEKSWSRFGWKNAIGAGLGWVQSDSEGMTEWKLTWAGSCLQRPDLECHTKLRRSQRQKGSG